MAQSSTTSDMSSVDNLLTALLGPEEFRLEETNEERFRAVRRGAAKV